MERTFSRILGGGLAALTLAGFVLDRKPKRWLGVMNVDTGHSVLRVPLTIALLSGSTKRTRIKTVRRILTGVGGFYIVMGILGLADDDAGGVLPSKLTPF